MIGIEMPDTFRGVTQYPMNGVSMAYSFDDAQAPTAKKRQYYTMLGTRGFGRMAGKRPRSTHR
ncbi:MAG: hypothetical protein R2845_08015 [Thermomicrobiales bacterium]